jgi:hypothetical protein
VEECNEGSGAACGAIFLTKGFENLLKKKCGDLAKTILTPKRVNEAIRFFESSIKQAFNPFDIASDDEYEIPLFGAPDVAHIGLDDNYLTLKKYESRVIVMLTTLEMTLKLFSNQFSSGSIPSSISK